MISIKYQSAQQIPVLVISGRFDAANCSEFDRALNPLLEEHRFFIIDFLKCNYLSSAGIRILLVSEKKLLSMGGGLFLCNLQSGIYQILEMAGLHKVFRLFESMQAAQDEIESIGSKAVESCDWKHGTFSFHFLPHENSRKPAQVWKKEGIAGYNELEVSIGTGSAAETPSESEQNSGFFITCCNCAGFIPNDMDLPPDFRIPLNPADAGIFIDQALSFGKETAGLVRLARPASMTVSQLADAIYPLKLKLERSHEDIMAIVFADFNPLKPSVSLCIVVDRLLVETLRRSGLHEIPGLLHAGEPGIRLWGARFVLEKMEDLHDEINLAKFLGKVFSIENVISIEFIHPGDPVVNPLSWVFASDGLADASEKRLGIETTGDFPFEPHQIFLTRRLYQDSARLEIKKLHGGYSAQAFQVASFDKEGRKLRPTVLKIASRALITRESERCRQHALPYILNNSAQVLGTEFFGDTGALRYNFVGIGGEGSQLKWLTDYYRNWPVERLEPLFDKIFLQILNPWYGQPIRETIYPYRDHDPTFTFFPRLAETAEELFYLSADEQYVLIEENGQKMINPYWFLKHEFARRRDTGIGYYTSICHGDLNMQNILLDEEMNVYLVDFSETRPRSLISDFARLEAIFMIEHVEMSNLDDIAEYVQFLTRFYSDIKFQAPPVKSYNGLEREKVKKNVAMTMKMREYAFNGVRNDPNPVPYCLALLEWVLPVVCYTAPVAGKRFSMIIAGLLSELVMKYD